MSHLRQYLPAYLKLVQEVGSVQITSRRRVIAPLEAEHSPDQAARQWLKKLHGRVKLLDVVSPLEPYLADLVADGDEDHQQHADHAVLDTLSERGSPQQDLRRLGKG